MDNTVMSTITAHQRSAI